MLKANRDAAGRWRSFYIESRSVDGRAGRGEIVLFGLIEIYPHSTPSMAVPAVVSKKVFVFLWNDLTDPVDGWQARYGNNLDGGNFLDWQRQFGSGVPPLAASLAVPEPSSVLLLIPTAVVVVLGRRRWCTI